MRMKKIALGLSMVMLLANMFSVSAAATSISGMVVNAGPAESQTVEMWNEINVPIRIDQNPGTTMFSFDVKFNSSVLEYLSCDSAENEVGNILAAGLADDQNDLVRIIGACDEYTRDSNKTGLLVTLKFRAIGTGTSSITVDTVQSQALRTDGTSVSVAASASASVTVTEGSTIVSAGIVTDVSEGWLVTVPVQISTNPGIAGYAIDVIYDDACLEFVRCENGTVLENLLAYGPYAEAAQPTIRVVGAQGTDMLGDGVLFNLFFIVKGGATGDIPVEIGTGSGLLNAANEEVEFTGQAGAVTLQGDRGNDGGNSNTAIVVVIAAVAFCAAGVVAAVKYRKTRTKKDTKV